MKPRLDIKTGKVGNLHNKYQTRENWIGFVVEFILWRDSLLTRISFIYLLYTEVWPRWGWERPAFPSRESEVPQTSCCRDFALNKYRTPQGLHWFAFFLVRQETKRLWIITPAWQVYCQAWHWRGRWNGLWFLFTFCFLSPNQAKMKKNQCNLTKLPPHISEPVHGHEKSLTFIIGALAPLGTS